MGELFNLLSNVLSFDFAFFSGRYIHILKIPEIIWSFIPFKAILTRLTKYEYDRIWINVPHESRMIIIIPWYQFYDTGGGGGRQLPLKGGHHARTKKNA